jgi:hypothetical protein
MNSTNIPQLGLASVHNLQDLVAAVAGENRASYGIALQRLTRKIEAF